MVELKAKTTIPTRIVTANKNKQFPLIEKDESSNLSRVPKVYGTIAPTGRAEKYFS